MTLLKVLTALALGLLLLISAAAAQGNGNVVTVNVYENTSDMSITDANLVQIGNTDADLIGNDNMATQELGLISGQQLPPPYGPAGQGITGANFAQIENADADLTGCDITATQALNVTAGENLIVGNLDESGLPDGETNFIQKVDADITDTGSNNVDEQVLSFYAFVTLLTAGNNEQIMRGKIYDSGSNNHVVQDPDVCEGPSADPSPSNPNPSDIPYTMLTRSDFLTAINVTACVDGNANYVNQHIVGSEEGDHLTDSQLIQQAMTFAYVTGNTNIAFQVFNQTYAYNDLTNSKLSEQVAISAGIFGNDNNHDADSLQFANQTAIANDLTNSLANELICLDEQIIGNSNDASQVANTDIENNLLTMSTEFQNIDAAINELGNGNSVDQNIDIVSTDSSAVGGYIVQQTEIETNS